LTDLTAFRGPLHAGTKDLHHYIEHDTVLGGAMAHGTPTLEQYAGWLTMKVHTFSPVESEMLPAARRADLYAADAAEIGLDFPETKALIKHREWLSDPSISKTERERRKTGTIYVCAGSVFGSALIKKRINAVCPDWPVTSLCFRDQASEIAYLSQLRQRGDCVAEARVCFAAMIAACEEIQRGIDSGD